MSDRSSIEWTDASWNPVTGCTQVSAGCDHCYKLTFAERFGGVPGHPYEQGFDLRMWPSRLDLPLTWRRPRRIFVNSMSDLFHKDIPTDYIRSVFNTMLRADWHVFQVLTKRPGRLRRIAHSLPWPENIWMGVSIETVEFAWRADYLREGSRSRSDGGRGATARPARRRRSQRDRLGHHWRRVGPRTPPARRGVGPSAP